MIKKLSLPQKIGAGLVLVLLFWLSASWYLLGQSTKLIFNTSVSWAPVPQYNYSLSFLQTKAGMDFSVWTFENKSSDKYFLYLHGNAGRLPNLMKELNKSGNVISPAYPGYHESESGATPENTYESADLTYQHMVRDLKIPENKITIVGHSMGGSPAVYVASKHNKAGKLVVINTFSSIQSMCFKQYLVFCVFAGGVFNSAENAKNVEIPVRQFAYRGDQTVPFDEGQKLYTYFGKSNDKKFIEMDKQTHSFPDWDKIRPEL